MISKHCHARLAVLCIALSCTIVTKAQFFDSLQARAGFKALFSSKNYQPLWLVANRYGTVADRKSDLSSFIRITDKHVLAQQEYQNDRGFYDYNDINLYYGLSIYNNNHLRSTIIEEGYVKLEYKNWSLRAGRFEETTGDIDPELSTGSLGISGNALPIPKMGIAVTDYTDIPFTSGWLQFKGTFAHGWLGNDRYIQNSYYHEKTFFLRAGSPRLKFYTGIEHFAEWGGKRDDQSYDKSLKGFWNVMLAKQSTNTDSETGTGAHTGDHRGVFEGGAYWENKDATVHAYLQKPFEGGHDIGFGSRNILTGFIVSLKNKYLGLQKILFEVISTKGINKNISPSQRESYYNNNVYKTGWEYQNNIIGTPLFINRARASRYFPEIHPFDWNSPDTAIAANANIINNRIFGIHIGASYWINSVVGGKTLVTYTDNDGNLNKSVPFISDKTQVYCLQQITYDIPKKNLIVRAGIGLDFGQLSQSVVAGGLLGIEWMIPIHKKADRLYW